MARDPGLQAERTALAWQRTGVSASAGSAVGLLAAAHDGRPWLIALVALFSVAGAVSAGFVARRPTPASGGAPGAVASPWGRLLATTGTTLLLAVTGTVLAVVALAR